ncbi:MAG: BadF/BadG/BcrA/BcrD ATPase family protein, partial [Vicinamibacterales bacterium]
PQALLHQVYHHNLKPAAISALAGCVQRAIVERDEAALAILRGAANELEGAALSVARRLELLREPFTFILSGGIFRAVPSLQEELAARFPGSAPESVTKLIDREPAEGALTFALQEARGGARIPVYKSR